MFPLLRVLTSESHTLVDHVAAYADLAGDELGALGRHWSRRAVAWAFAAVAGLAALVLGGVALMLWAVMPLSNAPLAWLLVAVPAVPAVLSVCAVFVARGSPREAAFGVLRGQLKEDLALLQEGLSR